MGKREYEEAGEALRAWGARIDEAMRVGRRGTWASYAGVVAAFFVYVLGPPWVYLAAIGIVLAGGAIAYWSWNGARLQRELHEAHERYVMLKMIAHESDTDALDVIECLERQLAAERALSHELQRRRVF